MLTLVLHAESKVNQLQAFNLDVFCVKIAELDPDVKAFDVTVAPASSVQPCYSLHQYDCSC